MELINYDRLPESMLLWGALFAVTWLGDRFVAEFVATLPPKSILRASDTVIHGIIGALSWQLVCMIIPRLYFDVCTSPQLNFNCHCLNGHEKPCFYFTYIYNMGIAFIMSSIVDLDHIILDVINSMQGLDLAYWQRGWFHYVVPPLLLALVLNISSIAFKSVFCLKLGTIVLVCVISHDIRDALHHGLWFQPFGVTPRFPYWLYIFSTMSFPFIVSLIGDLILLRIPKLNSHSSKFIV